MINKMNNKMIQVLNMIRVNNKKHYLPIMYIFNKLDL